MKDKQMPAYVISMVDGFKTQDSVRRYASYAGPSIKKFGGRFIVSNAQPELLEGVSTAKHISVVRFPSVEAAQKWYHSQDNNDARIITENAFEGRLLIILEGMS